MNKSIIFLFLLSTSVNLYAYIGPGMGGGIIAAVIGVIAAFIVGLWAILYYPIKRALKGRKNKKKLSQESNNESK